MEITVETKRRTRMSGESWFFLFSLVAAISLVAFVVGKSYTNGKTAVKRTMRFLPGTVTTDEVINSARPVAGSPAAPSVVVEFGDYECPPCRRAHENLKAAVEASKGRYRLAFRHFPLKMHASAFSSAVAAEMAGERGKFVQMHDLLYERQNLLSPRYPTYLLQSIGVGETDNLRKSAEKRVRADMAFAKKIGVTGTPTLVLCEPGAKPRVAYVDEIH